MINNIKIICSIGPASYDSKILLTLKDRDVDFFRINLSHTPKEEIEDKIIELKKYGVPVMIDTEGSQIRTGNDKEINFVEGEILKIYNKEIKCDKNNFFFTPINIIEKLAEGDLIQLDFNSALIKISNTSMIKEGYIESVVLIEGIVGAHKGIHVDSEFEFPPFSEKDLFAFEIAKKHNISNFSLSFIRNADEILQFKEIFPDSFFVTKIEKKEAVENLKELLEISPGILIDRGDLSREIPLQLIPFVQKEVIKTANEMGKEVFIATNTLENMSVNLKPMKSEINDVVNTLMDGATGIVLTKETAVGKYPVETVNLLGSLIKKTKDYCDNKIDLEDVSYELLPIPHGGKLVNRILNRKFSKEKEYSLKRLIVDEEEIMDAEQIAVGSFSPLEGFMKKDDLNSVINDMRLKNGIIWPIPIILQVKNIGEITEGEEILLVNEKDNEAYAILKLEEIYTVDKNEIANKWFGTTDLSHPGVKRFFEKGDHILGGKITLIKRRKSFSKLHELTPKQIRKIFSERGWRKVVGFHTRNVIHRSHEFIQMEAFNKYHCDGLFVHPVIGKKKKGDFEASVIIDSYEKMIKENYSKGKVVFSVLPTHSRYGGPREALFTAIIRKNFGCCYFIVGRDHTGVKDFYHPKESHDIFDKFSKEELGIEAIKFDEVFYSNLEKKYIHESESKHSEEEKLHLSGTQAREMFIKKIEPPEWFMRPEISKIILEKIKNGEKVFVE